MRRQGAVDAREGDVGQEQRVFQIEGGDTVATALGAVRPGKAAVLGDAEQREIVALEEIPAGHKIALRDIAPGEDIIKYGVAIGMASKPIAKGGWVHLHCMGSKYDEKSNKLDPLTGTSKETQY